MATTTMKAQVKTVDMSEEMEKAAIETAYFAITEFQQESQMAGHIKREFDKMFGPTWHCILGKNYGSHVVHATKNFIYFYIGQIAILLFKSG